MIVQELHAIQHRFGYLPKQELLALSARTGTRLHRIQEVASFFPHFRLQPPAAVQVRICQDMSCQLRGACDLIAQARAIASDSSADQVDVEGVSCLGRCDRAPAAYVETSFPAKNNTNGHPNNDPHDHAHELVKYYVGLDKDRLASILDVTISSAQSNQPDAIPDGESDQAWNADGPSQWEIDPYANADGRYQTIQTFVERMGVVEEVVDRYQLRGRSFNFHALNVINSKEFSQSAYAGKVLVLNVWSSEHKSSKDNFIALKQLHDLLGGGADRNSEFDFVSSGLNILGLNPHDSEQAIQAVSKKYDTGWSEIGGREAKVIMESLGIYDVPAVVLVGSDGETVSSRNNASSLDLQIQKLMLESALRAKLDADMETESQRILCSLFTANLLGMGGAGGRAYKKWFEVLQARHPKDDTKYVVCNGDESEPGTFKDREILLRTPHLVVEAVTLAGLLLNAERGYIYIRHEFPEQIAAVRKEINRAEQLGYCGFNILGTNRSFPIEVFVSPGGYICGEQTALIEAMEDKRAEPRNRPPELQTNGLWDRPTLLNNVETLAWIPAIVSRDNGKWFAEAGSDKNVAFKGRRFFSISGDVAKPGAYEVPIGITLGELIDDYAGGMANGKTFKAVALSGPSGGFLPRQMPVEFLSVGWTESNLPKDATHFDILKTELDIPVCRKMGVMMGAGMVVFGDDVDMVQIALSASTFYRNESCGKCVPCRIGSQKLVEIVTDISERKYTMRDIYGDGDGKNENTKANLVNELTEAMSLTAICGLGTVASNPLETLLNFFPDDVRRYAIPEDGNGSQ